jgi:hypothetical protein
MLPALLALIPLAYLIRMCVLRHVDVPFWDQYAMVPRLDHLSSGTLTLADFWGQHNEHRPLFPVATMLVLARLSGWNTAWEIATNVVLGVGIFAVFCVHLVTDWRDRGAARLWLLPVVSVLVFSPVQWENWVWGWQMTALMGTFAAVLGTFLLSRPGGGSGRACAAAIGCGVWSLYSFAAGVVYWAIGPLAIAANPPKRLSRRLAVWIGAAAVTLATYFYDYHSPNSPSIAATFGSLDAIRRFGLYALTYLGTPVAGDDQRAASVAGAILVASFAFLIVRLRGLRRDPAFLFPALIGLQTLGVAALSALGRASFGVEQAMSSRYCTISIPMWCAASSLLVLYCSESSLSPGVRAIRLACASVLLLVVVWSSVATGKKAAFVVYGRSETLRFARRGLITGTSDALLKLVYPNLAEIRERRATLLRLRLSVFRPSAVPTYPIPGPP